VTHWTTEAVDELKVGIRKKKKTKPNNVLLWVLHFKFLSVPFIQAKGNDCEGNTKPEAKGGM
jgi:hypothetical protein